MNHQIALQAPAEVFSDSAISERPAQCETHGDYAAKVISLLGREIVRGCPDCQAETEQALAAKRQQEVAERAKAEAERRLRQSGIPRRFALKTLDDFHAKTEPQKRSLAVARRLVETQVEGASAIFCGKPGTGKTHLACAVGLAMIERGKAVRFETVLSAIRHVKETYRNDSDITEKQAMADFLRPDLLILDEAGVQVGSEHEKMLLFEIINGRYQDCKSTILVSNLARGELAEYLGQRVMDRFAEDGAVVAFDWDSHRGKRHGL